MVFSDTTNKSGIIQTIERLTGSGQGYISNNADRLLDMTAMINRINHRVWNTIFEASGNWQYDDGNYSDVPYATTDIVSGQKQYSLPSDALTVQRIEAKNTGGVWTELTPITKEELKGVALDEFNQTDGSLSFYRLFNGVLELYPASDYASTSGLKIYYDRDSVDFASTDTNKTPGFASPYHEIIPIKASIEWFKINQPASPTLTLLREDDLKIEQNIKQFYNKRFKSFTPTIGRLKEKFI